MTAWPASAIVEPTTSPRSERRTHKGSQEAAGTLATISQRFDKTWREEPLLFPLWLLTLVTGLVDAACYLGLGRVFTANMTGNVVLLAFGAARAQGLPVLAPTVSLVVFLVGATGGGRLASTMVGPVGAEVQAPLRRRWVTVALLGELGLVTVAGMVALGLPV